MKGKDYKYILQTIDNEGFDYGLVHYTDFKEVEDNEFHILRENYLDARKALADYIGFED